MVQIQKLVIQNKSKGQIASKYLGNIQTEIYQFGCQYISNAIIFPAGSTRKRPGTRFICPAFDGKDTRLFIAGNFVVMMGRNNYNFIYGSKVVLSDRTTKPNPTITKSGTTVTGNNVYPSDILQIEADKEKSSAIFASFSTTQYPTDNDYPDFYHNRYSQKYDIELRDLLDKNTNFNKKPEEDPVDNANRQVSFIDNPDNAILASTPYYTAFPRSVDLANLDDLSVDGAVFKMSVLANASGLPDDKFTEYPIFAKTFGNDLYIPTITTLSPSNPSDPNYQVVQGASIRVPNTESPKLLKSDVINDFRIEYLDPDFENFKFKANVPITKTDDTTTVIRVDSFVADSGSTILKTAKYTKIDKILGVAIFQGRLVYAVLGTVQGQTKQSIRLYFSASNDFTNFVIPTGTPTAIDPFYLELDVNKFQDLNMLHEFANTLIIGTNEATYSLFSSSGIVLASNPIEVIKIADVGTAPIEPVLNNNNLYVVANNKQSLLRLTKEPLSVMIRVSRILTFSDVHNTNGYIKKLITWMWDYQYLGAVTTDGMFIKLNIDDDNVGFNIWNADKSLILDAVKLTVQGIQDVLYFVVHREGQTTIEMMLNNQEIPKYYHHYSVFRERKEEDEIVNQMTTKVVPHFVKNGFYADCAMTIAPKYTYTKVAVNADTATFSGGTGVLYDGDLLVSGGKQFRIFSFDKTTNTASIDNIDGVNFSDVSDFEIKRNTFKSSEYPMLKYYKDYSNVAIYGDGKSFYTSLYDGFNQDRAAFGFNSNDDLILNGYFSEITIGFVYRFLYVTTPISAPQSLEPSKPHTVNNLRVYMNYSFHIDFGMEPDKLDPIRLDKQNPIFGCQWFDLVNFNASGDAPNSLILKNDYPCPTEIVAINLSYSG